MPSHTVISPQHNSAGAAHRTPTVREYGPHKLCCTRR